MGDPLNSGEFLRLLAGGQQTLDEGFAGLPEFAPVAMPAGAGAALGEAARRMQDNYPYAHPLYAGQMLKPPHPVARAAYAMAMSINPNNHALDGGRASSAMELEAVAEIAAMFGMPQHLGHLTSSGTIANLEALWIAGQVTGGKAVAASSAAHYTHSRISGVLGLPFHTLEVDERNRIDLAKLEELLQRQEIGTVVATLGTTATGSVDPLDGMLELQAKYGFRIHVDAAYGGYFTLAGNLEPAAQRAYRSIESADSIVIDPHKHGLQPYGCGCVLFRDPGVGRIYKHDSPYTYFTSGELHLGEISLECSRAGASAVALWTTQRTLPLTRGGVFAQGLEAGREAALKLYGLLAESGRSGGRFVVPAHAPQLDIVFWTARGETPAQSSLLAQRIFDAAAKLDLHLALATLPTDLFSPGTWVGTGSNNPDVATGNSVLCLRSVLMKPEHLVWIERIWEILGLAADAVANSA